MTTYNQWLQPLVVAEYTGKDGATALLRTTTTHYDSAVRPDKTTLTTTGAVPGSLPVSATGTVYDGATGAATATLRYGSDGITETGRDTTVYDDWGRTVSYQAAGEASATTTTYDASGKVASVSDPNGSTSYTYDGNNADGTPYERRGLTRTVTVHTTDTSSSGAIPDLTTTGTYDAAGALTSEALPGGITRQISYDQVGQLDSLQWTGDITSYTTSTDPTTGAVTYTPGTTTANQPWLGWTQDRDSAGRVAHEWTPDGSAFTDSSTGASAGTPGVNGDTGNAIGYDRRYGYDRAGRLTTVYDRTASATGSTPDADTGAYPGVSCQTRLYSFDGNGNRTGVTLENAPTTGSAATGCPTGDGTSGGAKVVKSWAGKYATTDRLTAAASIATTNDTSGGAAASTVTTGGGNYTYDALGRATTIPNADTPNGATGLPGVNGTTASSAGDLTATYFDTDAVASLSQGGTTTSCTLDVSGRRATQSQQPTTGPNAGTPTDVVTRHYTDTGDNPAWVDHTVGAGSTAVTTKTRYAETLGGDLSYELTTTPGSPSAGPDVELPVSNPHGDTVTTITLPLSGSQATGNLTIADATCIGPWTDTDEYGNPTATSLTAGSAAAVAAKSGGVGYGWLGAKQRATDPTSGFILMGARLYNRVVGQFLTTDPVFGGNSTAYSYPQDPVNGFDLDGRSWWNRAVRWAYSGYRFSRNYIVSSNAYVVARAAGASCQWERGLQVYCHGARWGYGRGGTTYGNVFITGPDVSRVDKRLLNHERRHSSQWSIFGFSFIPLYFAAEGVATAFQHASGLRPHSTLKYNVFETWAGLRDGWYRKRGRD